MFVPTERVELSQGFPTPHPKCGGYTEIRLYRHGTLGGTRTHTLLLLRSRFLVYHVYQIPSPAQNCGVFGSRTRVFQTNNLLSTCLVQF